MSQNKKNSDFDVPTADALPYQPVLIDSFPLSKIPIFWGPNQTNCNYNTYSSPVSIAAWRQLEQLNIPRVVRFVWNKGEFGNDSDDDDGGTGGQRGLHRVTNYAYCNHDGICQLGVVWTQVGVPFPTYFICYLGLPDTPANFMQMQTDYPIGTEKESSFPIPNCEELSV